MENFDQIFTLLAVIDGITLNLDILETGVLNIIALIVILTYVIGSFLTSTLEKRKSDIVTGIQDAEERLSEANRRLRSEEPRLNSSHITISYAVFCLKKKKPILTYFSIIYLMTLLILKHHTNQTT